MVLMLQYPLFCHSIAKVLILKANSDGDMHNLQINDDDYAKFLQIYIYAEILMRY